MPPIVTLPAKRTVWPACAASAVVLTHGYGTTSVPTMFLQTGHEEQSNNTRHDINTQNTKGGEKRNRFKHLSAVAFLRSRHKQNKSALPPPRQRKHRYGRRTCSAKKSNHGTYRETFPACGTQYIQEKAREAKTSKKRGERRHGSTTHTRTCSRLSCCVFFVSRRVVLTHADA